MLLVLVPLGLLFLILLVPAIPKIGGEVRIGLLAAGLAAALLGGLGFVDILGAGVFGIDQLSWVIMLSIFGSIYAESQVKLGTMDTTLDTFRSLFGKSARGLVAAVILTLVLAGSLLGDAIAASTVIGFLVVRSLYDLRLNTEQISAIIVMGAVIGSGMPPITQAFFLSSSLIGIEPSAVLPVAYVVVGISVIIAIATGAFFIRNRRLPDNLVPNESTWQVLKSRWHTFVPLLILATIVVAASVFKYNIFEEWAFFATITGFLATVPIIQGLTFHVVMAIIMAIAISFTFPQVRKNAGSVVKGGLTKVSKTVQIQLCAGFMVGAFYQAGLIQTVKNATEGLAPQTLKAGGGLATIMVGMLTGSQTTAQTTIITFLGPALTNIDVGAVSAAAGAALLAMAGQSLPPVGLTTFVVAGIVGGTLNARVDPIKVMLLILPVSLYFAIAGFAAWFI